MAVLHVENVAISMCFHLVSSDHLQKEHWLFMARGSQTHIYMELRLLSFTVVVHSGCLKSMVESS